MSFQGTIDQYIALGTMFWFALRYETSPSIGDGGLTRSILQDFLFYHPIHKDTFAIKLFKPM